MATVSNGGIRWRLLVMGAQMATVSNGGSDGDC